MKTWKIVAIIATLAIVAAASLTVLTFAFANGQIFQGPYATNNRSTYGGYGGMMGGAAGSMMGGYFNGYPGTTSPVQPGALTDGNLSAPYYGGAGCGYNGNNYASTYTNGTALNITTAETIANNYLASLNNPNLGIKEIEQYSQNYYVQYYEKNTAIGAFEMIINPYTGAITPEVGPNMMWNTKYGMMSGISNYGGMMGSGIGGMMSGYGSNYGYNNGYTGTPTANMPINSTQASTDAQTWLNSNIAGATVGEVTPFYGYYHVMVQVNGSTYGMLSVNGYTGQVWYHNWHGTFIQEVDLS